MTHSVLDRFVAFHKVRIPRENLLNKTGDVTPDGRYVTPYKVRILKRHIQVISWELNVINMHMSEDVLVTVGDGKLNCTSS